MFKPESVAEYYAHIPTVLHKCDDPNCPGNRNRKRLELYDEMVVALTELKNFADAIDVEKRSYTIYRILNFVEPALAKAQQLEGE